MNNYDKSFFSNRQTYTLQSARKIIDILSGFLKPNSVVDAGCATGIWLSVFKENGTQKTIGIDGPWVPTEQLLIQQNDFIVNDFSQMLPDVNDQFDLAICIEVAEHITPEAGRRLIGFLTQRSDVVLFSAAVPGQGGTGHINEQLQSYWYKLFQEYGFNCYDIIRPAIWEMPDVNVIYKQNLMVYVKEKSAADQQLQSHPLNLKPITSSFELERLHPDLFKLRVSERKSLCTRLRAKIAKLIKPIRAIIS